MDMIYGGLLGLLAGWLGTFLVHRLPLLMLHSWRQVSQEELGLPVDPDLPELSSLSSHCPKCKRPLPFMNSLPLLGWLLSGRKCGDCGAPISLRNPLQELGAAAIGALAVAVYGWTLLALAMAAVGVLLLWSAFIDLEHKLLPNVLLYPIAAIGLFLSTFHFVVPPNTAIYGALAGYVILALPGAFYWYVLKVEGIGDSDPRLLMAIGTFVGPMGVLAALLVSTLVAGCVFGVLSIFRRTSLRDEIPFGPYLVIGGVLVFVAQAHGIPLTFSLY